MTPSPVRKVASAVLSYGVVGLVMWLLYRTVGNSGAVSDALSSISVGDVLIVSVFGLLYLASMLWPMVYTLPGLTIAQAGVARTTSLALANTVPEGGTVATGLTFGMYRSWGFTLADSSTSIIAIGIWTNLSRYVLMSVALVILVLFGTTTGSEVWIAVGTCVVVTAICLLVALVITNDACARRVGRALTRGRNVLARRFERIAPRDMEEVVADFREHLLARVRTCWRSLTATMLLSQLLGALTLGVALRLMGTSSDEVGWDRIVVAFGAMSLAVLLAPTPGGLGVADAVLIAVLGVGMTTTRQGELVAAVVLFRMATWLLPIPLGLIAYLYWRSTKNWRVIVGRPSSAPQPSSDPRS
ncbi:flippase-like domain-containing protein [Rhodococcus sp. PAMC28707]|uniref:lysylphosphatidylglycerol synthase transmembrane domain-containing protein n=1 Tax=unclassified Rhodococcus (in: high G+C Gram-positive bacteria) TaxID=192944 RepID=UPI00109DDD33|nr:MULTISPECIES: YbhN family protein [unclassified Rhodococcus (in: high G+C Gram-positive bacteria)]QCB50637.1 flippase-like domain-containing protein [Rhodococcus sp. PAMC28705]QCB57671.1 flippase-like domain-containing protein [Rhodococcus sp. PAMC28707]